MQLFSCLLFGISASLDGLLVGVGFGLRRVRILLWQNLFISLVTFLGTCLSALLGACLLPLFPPFFGRCAGSLVLILLGVYYIAKRCLKLLASRRGKRSEPTEASVPKKLTLPEVCLLSLTLSANNIGIGLSARMAGLPLLPAAVSTMLCSVLFLLMGNRLGRSRFLRAAGSAADPLSGLLLIALGILQLV